MSLNISINVPTPIQTVQTVVSQSMTTTPMLRSIMVDNWNSQITLNMIGATTPIIFTGDAFTAFANAFTGSLALALSSSFAIQS